MKRLAVSVVLAMAFAMAMAVSAQAASDTGNAPPTLSFYSGGSGANAHWQNDPNDSPNDDNTQDIEINTTTLPNGFAGVLVHHVAGTPTAAYPNSSFEVKSNVPAPNTPSLGSPRLVVQFSDGGRGELRPLFNSPQWEQVSDPNWDNNGGTCGYQFQRSWQDIQACHPGTVVTDVYIATDPYGFTYWIDNLTTAGKTWNEAADNGGATGL
jgi:hypothetical protein